MNEMELLRIKTTFVLQTLERALGDFTLDRASCSVLDEAAALDVEAQVSLIRDRVAESYLDGLFSLAIKGSHGTTAATTLLKFKQLCESLSIFEIRNACSHPNRAFFAHYWYRMAAIAQDPAIATLGLKSVSEALSAAENNTFETQDIGWSVELGRVLPNTLPVNFEHDRTGLLGRDQLVVKVCKAMVLGRFPTVALVAPGGVGKTALALEVLKQIAFAAVPSEFSSVIYLSLKTEFLTSEGLISSGAAPSMADLQTRLLEACRLVFDSDYSTLEEVFFSRRESRVLVCIDNLEGVLLSSGADFEDFLSELPPSWRVLITSRISLNSANCITVDVLPPSSAMALAVGYSRSIGLQIEQKSREVVLSASKNNPLAIKLMIDAIRSGRDVSEAAIKVGEDTLAFSYGFLIDSFTDEDVAVLEAMFSAGPSARSDLSLYCDIGADAVANSLGRLARTSLVSAALEAGVERYTLNDAVRDLLRIHPRNLRARSDISSRVANVRRQAESLRAFAAQRGQSEHSEYFVPPGHPLALVEIASLLNRPAPDAVSSALSRLETHESDCAGFDSYWLLRGMALVRFKDPQAEQCFRRALAISPSLRARASLARWLHWAKRYADAVLEFSEVEKLGGMDAGVVGDFCALRDTHSYLFSALFSNQYNKVLELTSRFVKSGLRSDRICGVRISAARMKFHDEGGIGMLHEISSTYSVARAAYGVTPPLAREVFKFIVDSTYWAANSRLSQPELEAISKFIVDNFAEVIALVAPSQLSDSDWVDSRLLLLANLLDDSELAGKLSSIAGVGESETKGGVLASLAVRVCNFHFPERYHYRFAVDTLGVRHYLRFEQFDGGQSDWERLVPGALVHVIPGDEASGGDCPRATRVSLRPIYVA